MEANRERDRELQILLLRTAIEILKGGYYPNGVVARLTPENITKVYFELKKGMRFHVCG